MNSTPGDPLIIGRGTLGAFDDLILKLTPQGQSFLIPNGPRCCSRDGYLEYIYHIWWKCRLCGRWWAADPSNNSYSYDIPQEKVQTT